MRIAPRLSLIPAIVLFLAGCTASTPAPPPSPVPSVIPTTASAPAQPAAAPTSKPVATQPAAAPTAPAKPATLDKVKAAQSGVSASQTAAYIALEKGFFREEGLDLELIAMGVTAGVAAVINDEVGYSLITGTPIRLATQGTPLKTVLVGVSRPLHFLLVQPEITQVSDLKGKEVGSSTGEQEVAFKAALRAFGMEKDINIINTRDDASKIAGMQTKAFAGVVAAVPYSVQLKQMGFRELFYVGDYAPQQAIGGIATSDKRLAERPDEVKRMIRGYVKGIRFAWEQPAESVQIIAKTFEIPPDTAQGVYEAFMKAISKNGLARDEAFISIMDDQKQVANLTGDVSVDQVRDLRLARQALAELNIPE